MEHISILDLVTLAVSVAAALFSAATYWRNVIHDRRQATLDAFQVLQEQAFDRLNQYTPAAVREIAQDPRSGAYKELSGCLARIEHFCVGVNQGIYDRNTMYELAHGYLNGPTLHRRIGPLLERKSRGADEDYYANLRSVLAWMEQETRRRRGSRP